MRTAVQMAPNDGFLLYNLGAAHEDANKYEEASRIFQRVLDLPDKPDDKRVVFAKRMSRLLKLTCDIGIARRSANPGDSGGGAAIISEMRR